MKNLKLKCYICKKEITEYLFLWSYSKYVNQCYIACKNCLPKIKDDKNVIIKKIKLKK